MHDRTNRGQALYAVNSSREFWESFALIDWQKQFKPKHIPFMYRKVLDGRSRMEFKLRAVIVPYQPLFGYLITRENKEQSYGNPSRPLQPGNQTSASKINCYVPVSTHYKSSDVERDMGSVSAIEIAYCWTVVKVLFLLHHISTSINLKNTQLVAHLFDFKISTKENK